MFVKKQQSPPTAQQTQKSSINLQYNKNNSISIQTSWFRGNITRNAKNARFE